MKIIRKLVKILVCLCVVLILFISILLSGCKVSYFSEEEHIQRIKTRLGKKYPEGIPMGDMYVSDYEVYPVYDENEKLSYFLVECEPNGFFFISAWDVTVLELLFRQSMYLKSNPYHEKSPWSPYTIDIVDDKPIEYCEKIWKLDQNNEKICYDRSPYYVTRNINNRKYFIKTESGDGICAVKNEGKYISLINETIFDISDKEKQATLYLTFIPKPPFYL